MTINLFRGGNVDIKEAQFSVNQTVGGNNYGSMNVAKENINSVNIVNESDKEELISIIKYLKTFVMTQEIDKEEKESVLDDLDTIEEQVTNKTPRSIKIKKAYDGVKSFIGKIPGTLATGTLIITKVEELYSKLKPLIEN